MLTIIEAVSLHLQNDIGHVYSIKLITNVIFFSFLPIYFTTTSVAYGTQSIQNLRL